MDGGVDLAIINFFGFDLMDRVQQHILKRISGEQPVGHHSSLRQIIQRTRFVAHTRRCESNANFTN